MRVHSAHTLTDWAHLSDHLGLTADIELLETDPQDSSAS
jgi:endonuclease/exonuclease/phosphatase family metal-dependent hydrolase